MLKKIKCSKVLIFAVIVCLVFSITVVSAFAFDFDYQGDYEFVSVLSPGLFPSSTSNYFIQFDFICDRQYYQGFELRITDGVVDELIYYGSDGNDYLVYQDGGWLDDSYRFIFIIEIYEARYEPEFLDFMSINQVVPDSPVVPESPVPFYSTIEEIIIDSVFGGQELTGEQTLAVSLLSTTLSLGAVLVPLLIVGACFVWILKRL